jgi:hypothetical protein
MGLWHGKRGARLGTPGLSQRRAPCYAASRRVTVATRLVNEMTDPTADDARALAQRVTIRVIDDIHDAAMTLADAAAARGLRVAACSDIASKEPMVDGDGGILNGEIFGWMADGSR